jgi:hypothetical protein
MDFFQLMGWKIVGTIDSDIKKCVMMIMPHTSAHDFYLGIFTRAITGLEMNCRRRNYLFFLWVILNTWEENRWIDLEE